MAATTTTPSPNKPTGWIKPEDRTEQQNKAHEQYLSELIKPFSASPVKAQPVNLGDRYPLWKVFEALPEKKAPYVNQSTGSCVGAGGYNALMTLMMVEIVTNREPEKWDLLWWPYTYEVSRYLAGFHSKGDGSLGTTWFKAIRDFGMPLASSSGLPQYQRVNGWLYLDPRIEKDWSYNPKYQEQYKSEGMEHPLQGGFQVTNTDELAAAITGGRSCTIASGRWGTRSSKNIDGWMVANWDDKWGHQEYVDEVCYPTKKTGRLFRIGNNWNEDAHPKPTQGEPAGGYYVREKDMADILADRDCECFALEGFKGIPKDQDIWDIIYSMILQDIFGDASNQSGDNN